MNRVRLFYKDISEIVGSNGFSVVRLSDQEEKQAISVICDKAMTEQLLLRINHMPGCKHMLIEVLAEMVIGYGTKDDFELMIYDVVDGQYCVSLFDKRNQSIKKIRMSDAVLFHLVSGIPVFIDAMLMLRQSSPYQSDSIGVSIPINTISIEHLQKELQRAIENEDYRLASHLHEEIKRRTAGERD